MLVSSSNHNTLIGNNASYNNDDGITLSYSSNHNTLSRNNVRYNLEYGIRLYKTNFNTLTWNNVSYNDCGIRVIDSSSVTIYLNNIYGNTKEISAGGSAGTDQWDNGKIGNYWGDYTSVYPSATNDGIIWSSPYKIGEFDYDHFPLVNLITIDYSSPQFTSTPVDLIIYQGYSDLTVSWIVTDLYPATYMIEINGNEVLSATPWTNGSTISYNIADGLLKGDYNIKIIVTDESGNIIQDTVILIVTSTETTTTTTTTDDATAGFSLIVAIFAGVFLLIRRIKVEKNL